MAANSKFHKAPTTALEKELIRDNLANPFEIDKDVIGNATNENKTDNTDMF